MTCEQCKYHAYIYGTHFCDSKNRKRRVVRISKEDAKKDLDCLWAEPQKSETWEGIHAQITAPRGTFKRIFNDIDDEDDI